jgi:hypothetical protein
MILFIQTNVMKNLILLFVLMMLSFNTYSQCYIGKKDGWYISDGVNTITNDGFVIVSHFPEVEEDKGRTSFRKVEKLSKDTIYSERNSSYFYYFDFTTKQLDIHDCNGQFLTCDLGKIKIKGDTYYITINEKRKKIKFKIIFHDYVEFTYITYYKHDKSSVILVNKHSTYYSKK